jgi:uncharacterized protein (DUF2236 family)
MTDIRTEDLNSTEDFRVLTDEKFLGTASRWRRLGEPVAAGDSTKPNGDPDYGLFGPGTMVWEVLLHPATVVFEAVMQSLLQTTYKPIVAGVRDHDIISRKARAGTLTVFDVFERFQRNSGMHAPMWLGDTKTAQTMADHLGRVHKSVVGDVIDIASPELGGYDAASPREVMWAAVTEMDAMLHLYESFAFQGSEPPRKLSAAQRDQYWKEAAAYVRLVGAPEDEIPTSDGEVEALYEKYDKLFGHTPTIDILPNTGENFAELTQEVIQKNFHPSQAKAAERIQSEFGDMRAPVFGALRERSRRHTGLDDVGCAAAVQAVKDALPSIKLKQEGENERQAMRLMWGPDGVMLIDKARALHAKVLAGKLDSARVSQ